MAEAEEPEEGLDSEVTRLRKELAAAENAAADWAAERRLAEERGKEREEVARQAEELRRSWRKPEQHWLRWLMKSKRHRASIQNPPRMLSCGMKQLLLLMILKTQQQQP